MPEGTAGAVETGKPDPRDQAINALVVARVLSTAENVGVFGALKDGPRTSEDVAADLDVDEGTLRLFLRVLVGQGYLEYSGGLAGSYGFTSHGREYLLPESANTRNASIGLGTMVWDQLTSLGDVLKTGEGVDMHHALTDETAWASYQQAMVDQAKAVAPGVAAATPVRAGATRLLDVAGSHGMFGAVICREHPPMKSVVLDLPNALDAARRIAVSEGIDDVVEFREGDLMIDEFPGDQDVVFLGNILHHFDADDVQKIIAKVKDVLVPGGTIAIWENPGPEADTPPDFFTDTSALLFRVTSSGRSYPASDYVQWAQAAGFEDAQIHAFPPVSALITARIPD